MDKLGMQLLICPQRYNKKCTYASILTKKHKYLVHSLIFCIFALDNHTKLT